MNLFLFCLAAFSIIITHFLISPTSFSPSVSVSTENSVSSDAEIELASTSISSIEALEDIEAVEALVALEAAINCTNGG